MRRRSIIQVGDGYHSGMAPDVSCYQVEVHVGGWNLIAASQTWGRCGDQRSEMWSCQDSTHNEGEETY